MKSRGFKSFIRAPINRTGEGRFLVVGIIYDFMAYQLIKDRYFELSGRMLIFLGYTAFVVGVVVLARLAHRLEPETFQKMFQKVLTVLGFCDVLEHNLANFFRIRFINNNHDKRHKELVRLQKNFGRQLVMGNPK